MADTNSADSYFADLGSNVATAPAPTNNAAATNNSADSYFADLGAQPTTNTAPSAVSPKPTSNEDSYNLYIDNLQKSHYAKKNAPTTPQNWHVGLLKGVPLLGKVEENIEDMAQNAYEAPGQIMANPVASARAGVTGLASGAVSAVEDPLALGYQYLRQNPAVALGMQAGSGKPMPETYNQAVGGTPVQQRISDLTKQENAQVPAVANTAKLAGGMMPIAGQIGKLEAAANMVGQAAKQTFLKNFLKNAGQGAAAMGVYGPGSRMAYGQQVTPQNVAEDMTTGAVVGGVGGETAKAASKGTGRAITQLYKNATETPKETAPRQITQVTKPPPPPPPGSPPAALPPGAPPPLQGRVEENVGQPQPAAETTEPESVQLQKSISQVKKPKVQPGQPFSLKPYGLDKSKPRYRTQQLEFKSDLDKALYVVANRNTASAAHNKFMEALQNAGYKKNDIYHGADQVKAAVKQAAATGDEVVKVPSVIQQSAKRSIPQPEAESESQSLMTPEQFDDKVSDHEKSFYDKWGKEPLPESTEEEPINKFEERIERPTHEMKMYNPANRKYDKDFNADEFSKLPPSEQRLMWRGAKHAASVLPNGNVRLGERVGDKGGARTAAAVNRLQQGTDMGSMIATGQEGKRLTDVQQKANQRSLEGGKTGETPKEQTAAAQRAADLQKALDAIEHDEPNPPRKMTTLHSEILPVSTIFDIAKLTKQLPSEVARSVVGSNWRDSLTKLTDFRDTIDRIRDGSKRNGSDLAQRLDTSHTQQALDSLGADITNDKMGVDARNAIRTLSVRQIVDPDITPAWTPQQREMVAKMKYYREEQRGMIRDEVRKYGDEDPDYANALQEYNGRLLSGHSDLDGVLSRLNSTFYKAILSRNPAFHGLVLTHPLQIGTSAIGIKPIVQAYNLRFFDPKVKEFLGSTRNITGDYREAIRQEQYAEEGTEAPADIPSSRWNNEVVMLAGMVKKSGVEGVHSMIDNFNAGKAPTMEDANTMFAGLDAIRDTTGNLIGGANHTYLQRHPIFRYMAQLSGYRGTVDRLLGNAVRGLKSSDPEVRNDSGRRLTTWLAMTVALGGSAPVPQEVRDALFEINPRAMYGLEYVMNHMNVLSAVTGRNLRDHMQSSLLNWGVNVGLENVSTMAKALDKQWKETEDMPMLERMGLWTGRLMWELPWTVWGFGSNVIHKNVKNLAAAKEGQKDVYAFGGSKLTGERYEGKGSMKYGYWDAVADNLPGAPNELANWRYKKDIGSLFKKTNTPLPENLESDYPSPNVQDVR